MAAPPGDIAALLVHEDFVLITATKNRDDHELREVGANRVR
jgi:hypothetical protein